MTDDEKQALRNSMAGKKVSEMAAQERELFDQEFQYGLNDTPQIKCGALKSEQPSKPKDGLSQPHEFNSQKVIISGFGFSLGKVITMFNTVILHS